MQLGMTTAVQGSYQIPARSTAERPEEEYKGLAKAEQLSEEDNREVERLKARDREVRAHEMAHLAAAGGLATSGARFTYEKGPDGVRYAVGGEVGIDTSSGRTPEETLQRARIIRAAALAPAEPSGQDRAVAAKATQMEAEARAELARDQGEEGGNLLHENHATARELSAYKTHQDAQPGRQLDTHA